MFKVSGETVFFSHQEAQAYVEDNSKKGCYCPTCGQYAKQYRRPIAASAARGLINLYKLTDGQGYTYHYIDDFLNRTQGADFAKLRYWGLIDEKPNIDDPEKKHTGFWTLTKMGLEFVQIRRAVMKYVHLYNGEVLGFSGDKVDIKDCLKGKFNYTELMA